MFRKKKPLGIVDLIKFSPLNHISEMLGLDYLRRIEQFGRYDTYVDGYTCTSSLFRGDVYRKVPQRFEQPCFEWAINGRRFKYIQPSRLKEKSWSAGWSHGVRYEEQEHEMRDELISAIKATIDLPDTPEINKQLATDGYPLSKEYKPTTTAQEEP